jgi:ubiquinone/menaquinone biosynthesis C-methylase UbiE
MFTEKDREKCEQIYDKYYRGRKFHDSLYRDLIRKYLRPGQRVLDAGCGRYLRFCRELSDTATVVGIDLDSVLETDNTAAPFAIRGDVGALPFPSAHFDMVISRSVVEHLEDPSKVFREFARVLRPGGKVVVITPNKYDYVSVIAALTPYKVHRSLVSRIFHVPEDDIFPTLYRANTRPAIRKTFDSAGLVEKELNTINHYPAYLMFSPMLFRLGVLYERVTSMAPFAGLRGSLLGVFEKPAAAGSAAEAGLPRQRVGVS